MGSKSQQSTSTSSTTPNNLAALQGIYNAVSGAASSPYQAYTGQLTAPVNAQQTTGINNINANANYANPFIQQAGGLVQGASQPLTASQIQNYANPYTQSVVDATQAQFNKSNAEGQNSLKGNAAIAGALGGDRQAVAQSQLAGQQATAQAPVIANLYSQGYNNAVNTATNQYQQNPLAQANALANYGVQGQNAALTGANAQIGAGTLQQQTQQAQDTANYGQFQNQQAYPFQTAAFLQQYGLPTVLAQGSSSSGTQTTPGPNPFSQVLGLGTAALTAYSDERVKENIQKVGATNDGQPIYRFNYKGSPMTQIGLMAQDVEKSHPEAIGESNGIKTVDYAKATDDATEGFATGGGVDGYVNRSPFWQTAQGYVPTGGGASNASLQAPQLQFAKPQSQDSSGDIGKMIGTAGKVFGKNSGTPDYGQDTNVQVGGYSMPVFGTQAGGSYSNPLSGLSQEDYDNDPEAYRLGGFVGAINQIHSSIKRARGGTVSANPFSAYSNGGSPVGEAWSRAVKIARQSGPIVSGYADGGEISMEDRFGPVKEAIASGNFDPQGINSTEFGGSPMMVAANEGRVPIPMVRPSGASPMQAPLPPQITNPDNAPDEGPSSALAYDGTRPTANPMSIAPSGAQPQAPAESRFGSFNPFNLSDKAREAIITGALGMAASRSPFIGTAIAEGGLHGMGAYSAATKAEQGAANEAATKAQNQQRIDMEAQRLSAALEKQRLEIASAPLIRDAKGNMAVNPAYLDYKKQEQEIVGNSKFTPIGSVMSGDTVHPLVMDQRTGQVIDAVTQKPPTSSDKIVSKDKNSPEMTSHIAEGIKSERQPPVLTGLYGQSAPVRSKLEEDGFDLSKAQVEWDRAKKQVATLNGPQMTRFVGLAKSVDSTIDEVRNLAKEMDNSGIPKLNAAKLALYMQAEGNSANGQLAARYIGAVNTLKEEFANLANGGYAPTEPAWELANKQINGDYGVKQLSASLDEVQRLVRYRVNAIPGLNEVGPGAANRYTGQTGAAPAGHSQAESAPDHSGWQWNPARKQYRDSSGNLYDESGKPVRP